MSTDRIREAREALDAWESWSVVSGGLDQFEAAVVAAARSFVEGELPPGFPTDEDVEVGGQAAITVVLGTRVDTREAALIEDGVYAALVAVAESRRPAAHLLGDIRRVSGTKYPNMVCKFCAHGKTWHRGEGPCRLDECDCEAWDYGVNVESVNAGDTQEEDG